MIYFLYAVVKNLIVLWFRLVLWPLLLLGRLRPAMLEITVPASLSSRPPSRIARWLGQRDLDHDSFLRMLSRARREPAIRGVVLLVPEIVMGRSTVTEIREALGRVVGAGKEVVVVLREGGGTQELRLAPAGARIVLHPSMGIRLSGPAAAPFFLGDLLKKHGIKADLHAVGDYKTAPETFTRGSISEENRAQLMEIISDLDDHLDRQIASGRGVEVQKVEQWKQKAVFTADEAVEAGVVDEAGFDTDVIDGFKGRIRVARPGDRLLRLRHRLRFVPFRRPVLVGVVRVKGQILSRSGPAPGSGQALADKIAPVIVRAGKDPSIRAIVLELDTRGGSAIASDTIYRKAVEAAARKPLVVYMRDVAASGGYYIASASQKIVANPECLTGSIGVFGGKIAADGILGDFDVSMERVTRGDPGAGIMLPDRPFDEPEKALVLEQMQSTYDTFLSVVAERKGSSTEEIEPLAGGRVYMAGRARDVGLVDELGTWTEVEKTLAAQLGLSVSRLRLVRMGRSDPLESLGTLPGIGLGSTPLARMVTLVAREGICLETPFTI